MGQYNSSNNTYIPQSKTLHETSLTVDRQGNPISGDYALDIGKGAIPGHSVAFVSGRNPSVNTALSPCTIWNGDGTYPWAAWDPGANTIYLSSNNAADTANVTIIGLDTNFDPLVTTIQLNGLTAVNTGNTKFRRINSAYYTDTGSMNAGVINLRVANTAGSVVGRIDANFGQTSMAIYTVPRNHTAYSVYGDFSVNKNEGAELSVRWRFPGSGFITVYGIELYQTTYSAAPLIPGKLPGMTDIDNCTRIVTTNGTRVYSNQQLVLVLDTEL